MDALKQTNEQNVQAFPSAPWIASLTPFLVGRTTRFRPIAGVFSGDSPVKINRSYRNPPNVPPMNGHIMGTLMRVNWYQNSHQGRYLPEVVITCTPNFRTVPDHVCEQSWTKVSSKINRIAGLPAECSTNSENEEEQHQWCQISGSKITIVLQRENDEDKYSTGDDFGEDLSCFRQERLRISVEDASCRSWRVAWDCPNARTSFVLVDRRLVVPIDDGGTAETSKDLSASICRPLPPGKPAYTSQHGPNLRAWTTYDTCNSQK